MYEILYIAQEWVGMFWVLIGLYSQSLVVLSDCGPLHYFFSSFFFFVVVNPCTPSQNSLPFDRDTSVSLLLKGFFRADCCLYRLHCTDSSYV